MHIVQNLGDYLFNLALTLRHTLYYIIEFQPP